MVENLSSYYVYVYIDPRNFEEFYYGKGKWNRKDAHLSDESDTEKVKRIKAIKKEGLEPIIKVIAKDLTEREAFLVEKTLIWKLGRTLLNISSGQFADKFRKHDTLHLELSGFDFSNGLYYVNVGEGNTRCWADCREYGFLSAWQDMKYSNPIQTLEIWDIVVAYLKNHGYVGIGRVIEKAIKVNEYRIAGQSLKSLPLKEIRIFENSDNEKSEYLVKVEWIRSVESNGAKWQKKSKLFSSQLIKASLEWQKLTREFLETEFDISFRDLLLTD